MIALGKLNSESKNGIYRVTTESGAEYRITLAEGKGYIQRTPGEDSSKLRRDSEPIELITNLELEVNKQGNIWLEPLGQGFATVRITTPVTSIENIE